VLVRARLLTETARLPTRAHDDDAAFDLYADESVDLAPGTRASVSTGIALALPEGTAGLVLPRSGLAARHGITVVNSPGLVDPGYRGAVTVVLLNTDRETPHPVRVGDRIAQLLITETASVTLEQADELGVTTRGAGGFGSTGR
jgi:dUTP pyrophosphatase